MDVCSIPDTFSYQRCHIEDGPWIWLGALAALTCTVKIAKVALGAYLVSVSAIYFHATFRNWWLPESERSVCQICLEPGGWKAGLLIWPCRCKGRDMGMHQSCYKELRDVRYDCALCKSYYGSNTTLAQDMAIYITNLVRGILQFITSLRTPDRYRLQRWTQKVRRWRIQALYGRFIFNLNSREWGTWECYGLPPSKVRCNFCDHVGAPEGMIPVGGMYMSWEIVLGGYYHPGCLNGILGLVHSSVRVIYDRWVADDDVSEEMYLLIKEVATRITIWTLKKAAVFGIVYCIYRFYNTIRMLILLVLTTVWKCALALMGVPGAIAEILTQVCTVLNTTMVQFGDLLQHHPYESCMVITVLFSLAACIFKVQQSARMKVERRLRARSELLRRIGKN
jgi:hypothetical protein